MPSVYVKQRFMAENEIVYHVTQQGALVAQRRRTRERRRSQRLSIAIPIFARALDSQGREFLEFTTALNISAGGALLALRRYLPPESAISLEIPAAPLPHLASPPKLLRAFPAQVVRVTPSEPSYLCAIRFNHPLI